MSQPLEGRTVALAEGRQIEELADLLQQEGAAVLRCPMLSILDAPDAAAVEVWLRDLIAGQMGLVVLMTGEAVRRLAGVAERAGLRDAYVEAMGRVAILARGPKPIKALRELGLPGAKQAASPTTEGVIATLKEEKLAGVTVGLTLYGHDNPTLEGYLRDAGATVRTVLPYVFAAAADDDRVAELIDRMGQGKVDAVVFTSSPQVDRLWEVAGKRGLEEQLRQGLERTTVAAVGPLVADALRDRGAMVHVCPEQGWVMKNLVRQLVRALEQPSAS
jgi:uroporphyrinogen-III synthase